MKSLPGRRRRAAYDQVIVDRLLKVSLIAREMLCYALYRRSNHIWISEGSGNRDWVNQLKVFGLIETESAEWDTVHFAIHPVAWMYMQRYPTKFLNAALWPQEPWVLDETQGKEMREVLSETTRTATAAD
jgi:hypothetical protein